LIQDGCSIRAFALFFSFSMQYAVVISLSGLLLAGFHGVASANVWKFVDKNGVTQYTNVMPQKKAELIIQFNPAPSRLTQTDVVIQPRLSAQSIVAVISGLPAYKAAQGSLSSASQAYGVDLELIKAVVATESAFNPSAVSNKGAVGLMQLMPATARRYGVQDEPGATVVSKLKDPDLSIHTGTRHLADLLRLFGGQTELALAAYNAGEGAVARAGNRIPNYNETQAYVVKVMGVYRALQARAD
jgi:soluble lytic murein transglycosylase-like protein